MQWTYEDDGVEQVVDLPSQKAVCPNCEGEGRHLTPSIREHAYSWEAIWLSDLREISDTLYKLQTALVDLGLHPGDPVVAPCISSG